MDTRKSQKALIERAFWYSSAVEKADTIVSRTVTFYNLSKQMEGQVSMSCANIPNCARRLVSLICFIGFICCSTTLL